MRHKKVLIILRIPPPFGGGEIVAEELFHQLKGTYGFHLIRQKNHSKSKQAKSDIQAVFRSVQYVVSVIWAIVRKRPEVIYIGIPKTLPAFARNAAIVLFCRVFRISVYGELHGMSFPFLDKKYTRRFYRFVINHFSKIRVLSQSIKAYLHSTGYKNQLFVISNGLSIDSSKHKVEHPSAEIKLLYIGGISRKKGIFRVIELISILKNKGVDFTLNVIGEWVSKTEKREVLALMDQYGLNEKVVFHGMCTGNDKWRRFSDNDLHLHFTEFDGQPLTIIEAMALGIPSIATKVGAIPEMISSGHNGILIDSVEEAAEQVNKLNKHPEDYEIMSNNARQQYTEKYSASTMALEIKNMIEY